MRNSEKQTMAVIGAILFLGLLMGVSLLLSQFVVAEAQEKETSQIQTEDSASSEQEEEDKEEEEDEEDEEEEEAVELEPGFQKVVDEVRAFWKRESESEIEELVISPFRVPPRKEQYEYYPCMDCHEEQEVQPERELTEEHEDLVLDHGKQRFWCLTCHFAGKEKNYLRSLKEQKIDFNESHLLCGQCHFERQKDWLMGAHGKRVGSWSEERTILLCVECHNPHSPAIKPQLPDPIPKGIREIRMERSNQPHKIETKHELIKVWDRIALKYKNERTK
ncbi:MAG: hypothetical protein HQM13_20495 [SAR324 cluster bacterium]|nr:hypothetical protein [SAR324 cluster bacterium]